MLRIVIPGEIRGKGRPRFARGRGPYTDAKTANAETWVRSCAVTQIGIPLLDGPISITLNVAVSIPQSKSKRWKADALAGRIRPIGKPDFDNTSKLICDALNKIVWKDDSQITDVLFTKHYSEQPGAELIVRKVEP